MGLFDRIGRLLRANVNDMVSKAEDPEKILEQAVSDMQEDLIKLRQAVATSIANQKRTEQQYNKAVADANGWQQKAQLALQKGDENLAREALTRKKTYADTAAAMKAQLDNQSGQVESLKRNLVQLESKIAEAKTKKNMLQARAKAAKATEQITTAMGQIDTASAMNTFGRMEEKVLELEAKTSAMAELAGDSLENQFAALESGGDVESELQLLKAQMDPSQKTIAGTPQATEALPAGKDAVVQGEVVDSELEELRAQIQKPST